MKSRITKYFFLLMVAVLALSSCSEADDTTQEFDNWQAKNETAFADTLAYAMKQIDAGSMDWKVIRNWSLSDQTPNKDVNGNTVDLTYKDVDYIVVHVLEHGTGSGSPMYTDSVRVSYSGRLLPSPSYENGYVFDKTFEGTYNKQTARQVKMSIGSLIDGFTTALLNMHVGDRWMVYMPYQLAYGVNGSSSGSIPGYSMLRFEIMLGGYFR